MQRRIEESSNTPSIFNQYNIIEKINPQRGLFKPDLQSQHGDLDL